jgi:hypothetical protein
MRRKTVKNKEWSDPDLLPEYDFDKAPVLGRGPDFHRRQMRRNAGLTVRIAPDVEKYFPDAQAVNEALRTLINLIHRRSSR